MNILFDNLELLIDAPNGIEKARELILQLAIQGKLTEQDPNDEPASELLKKIKKEKEKLIAEGKIKHNNVFEPIREDEIPFLIPNNWIWLRIGLLGEIFNGNSINKEEKAIKYSNLIDGYDYIGTKDVDFSKRTLNYNNGIRIPFSESNFRIAHKGSVLICSEGGSAGRKAGIVEKDICFGNKLFAIEPFGFLEQLYIYFVYSSPYFLDQFSDKMTGIIGGISLSNFKSLLFPLPPLNEQKRIVEKVNSLMALLDELEEKRERRNQKRIKLNIASLDKLLTSKDDNELKTNWKRIEENFSTLYSVSENVEKLKQAILQLAIQGKLVQQDPNDEPASELLKKIKKEKEKLIADGKIKKQKELPPIKDEEKPFELPKGWEWGRIGNLFVLKTGATPSTGKKQYFGGDIKWLVSGDIHKGEILECDGRITEEGMRNSNCKLLPANSVLIALNGQGKTRATVAILRTEATCNQSLVAMIPIGNFIMPEYLYFNLKGRYYEIRDITGRKQRRGLNMGIIGDLTFSIPPHNEQKRIVEKVNELMGLCNSLEEKLTKKEATAEKLVGAVVNAVVNNK